MSESFASGTWHVLPGKDAEFVHAWTEFLQWTSRAYPGLVVASLLKNEDTPGSYVSFAEWGDAAARTGWKADPGFAVKMAACRALCERMVGGNYERVVTVRSEQPELTNTYERLPSGNTGG